MSRRESEIIWFQLILSIDIPLLPDSITFFRDNYRRHAERDAENSKELTDDERRRSGEISSRRRGEDRSRRLRLKIATFLTKLLARLLACRRCGDGRAHWKPRVTHFRFTETRGATIRHLGLGELPRASAKRGVFARASDRTLSSRARVGTNATEKKRQAGWQVGREERKRDAAVLQERCNDELCNLWRVSEATQFTKLLPTRRSRQREGMRRTERRCGEERAWICERFVCEERKDIE